MSSGQRHLMEGRLLSTLEQLLAIEGQNLNLVMDQASDLLAEALRSDKIDVFLYDPAKQTLRAIGTSRTPMGRLQEELGLDQLPLANGGPDARVLETGKSYHTGHLEDDPTVPRGVIKKLGVRSMIAAPLPVGGERRGVLQASSAQPDHYTEEDLHYLEAVAHWVGTLMHRIELTERVAKDAAEEARRLVAEELIAVLAHDLNNYITPLKAWIGLAHRRAVRAGAQDDIDPLGAASRAVERLQSLIQDLLDVSRLDQGLFSLSPQHVDLVALIEDTTNTMDTGQLKVLLKASEDLVIQADPMRLRQAVENLIANALKHSPDGAPVEVEITSEQRRVNQGKGKSGSEEWAIITVRDHGPGVPEEVRPRLFTRFSRGPKSGGLGLGLYLARSIAEAHGGTLSLLDGEGDQGATFQLAIPRSL